MESQQQLISPMAVPGVLWDMHKEGFRGIPQCRVRLRSGIPLVAGSRPHSRRGFPQGPVQPPSSNSLNPKNRENPKDPKALNPGAPSPGLRLLLWSPRSQRLNGLGCTRRPKQSTEQNQALASLAFGQVFGGQFLYIVYSSRYANTHV